MARNGFRPSTSCWFPLKPPSTENHGEYSIWGQKHKFSGGSQSGRMAAGSFWLPSLEPTSRGKARHPPRQKTVEFCLFLLVSNFRANQTNRYICLRLLAPHICFLLSGRAVVHLFWIKMMVVLRPRTLDKSKATTKTAHGHQSTEAEQDIKQANRHTSFRGVQTTQQTKQLLSGSMSQNFSPAYMFPRLSTAPQVWFPHLDRCRGSFSTRNYGPAKPPPHSLLSNVLSPEPLNKKQCSPDRFSASLHVFRSALNL